MPSPACRNIDAAAVKASVSLLDIAQRYGLKLRKEGREWRGASPFKTERTPSFYIDEQKGLFKCFASGEGGDVIRFVQLMDGCGFKVALQTLCGEPALSDPEERARLAAEYERRASDQQKDQAERTARHVRVASAIWHAARPADGTPAETYLLSRGIDLDALERCYGWRIPPSLRFHPDVRYKENGKLHNGSAMIGIAARYIRGRRHLTGIHRTWLAPDGKDKAAIGQPKMTLGHLIGASSPLSPVCEEAVLGEGYETTLSVMAALAQVGRKVYGVSGLFLNNITGAGRRRAGSPKGDIPIDPDPDRPGLMLPEGVKRVILLKDADGKRPVDIERFMRRAATKFQRAGLEVCVASPVLGSDFNDMAKRTQEVM